MKRLLSFLRIIIKPNKDFCDIKINVSNPLSWIVIILLLPYLFACLFITGYTIQEAIRDLFDKEAYTINWKDNYLDKE